MSIFGFLPAGSPSLEQFERMLSRVSGVTEVMAHPAYCDDDLASFWRVGVEQTTNRRRELDCMASAELKRLLERYGVKPKCYQQALT